MGTFFYRFWTSAWPRIGKRTVSDLSEIKDQRRQNLIRQATNAIEDFANFGCIATGILQIIALNFHQTIWKRYAGWLRTVTSTVPSEEVVKTVIQQEYLLMAKTGILIGSAIAGLGGFFWLMAHTSKETAKS